MAEVPCSGWSAGYEFGDALSDAPLDADWRRAPGVVRHVFTHFPLELAVFLARLPADTPAPEGMRWTPRAALAGEALPNLMRKVLAHALDARR